SQDSSPQAIAWQHLVRSALASQRIVAPYRTLSGQALCSLDALGQAAVSAEADDQPSVSHVLLAPPAVSLLSSSASSYYQTSSASAHASVRADSALSSFFELSALFSIPSRDLCPFSTRKFTAQGGRSSRSFVLSES